MVGRHAKRFFHLKTDDIVLRYAKNCIRFTHTQSSCWYAQALRHTHTKSGEFQTIHTLHVFISVSFTGQIKKLSVVGINFPVFLHEDYFWGWWNLFHFRFYLLISSVYGGIHKVARVAFPMNCQHFVADALRQNINYPKRHVWKFVLPFCMMNARKLYCCCCCCCVHYFVNAKSVAS